MQVPDSNSESPKKLSRACPRAGQQLGQHATPAVVILIDAIASSVELVGLGQIAVDPTLQLSVDRHAGQVLEVAAHASVRLATSFGRRVRCRCSRILRSKSCRFSRPSRELPGGTSRVPIASTADARRHCRRCSLKR